MKTYLATLIILNCLLAVTFAVSDDNICEQSCQYCCRNKQCQSQSTCKGNYQPFIILGCIAGGLIGLFIARRIYVHYRNKAAIARGEDPKAKRERRPWRRSRKTKSPAKEKKDKESVERKKSKSKKEKAPSKPKSLKDADEKNNKSRGDVYLQIDNESVLSAEDVKSTTNKEGKMSSRNDLKPTSKNEILVKSDTNLDDKDRLNPYKQNRIPDMPAKDPKAKDSKNKDDKRSTSKGKTTSSSKKPASSMKDSKMEKSMTKSKDAGTASKERGRSREPTKGGERSASQKKTTSTGPKGDKSRATSAGKKDRV